MGFAPPPDTPSIDTQAGATASASFTPSPSGPELCGFGFPLFALNISFRIPSFPPFPFPPTFNYMIALKCDLSNPIDASFSFGGGRVANQDPDPLDEAA